MNSSTFSATESEHHERTLPMTDTPIDTDAAARELRDRAEYRLAHSAFYSRDELKQCDFITALLSEREAYKRRIAEAARWLDQWQAGTAEFTTDDVRDWLRSVRALTAEERPHEFIDF